MRAKSISTYKKDVFDYLVSCLSEDEQVNLMQWHCLQSTGVYLRPLSDFQTCSPTTEELKIITWHPYRNRFLPALPFPFTAHQLAAFCLPGYGSDLLNFFIKAACFEDEPNLQNRPKILDMKKIGQNAGDAAEVLSAAHELLARMLEINFENTKMQKKEVGTSKNLGQSILDDEEIQLENSQINWLLAGDINIGVPQTHAPLSRQRSQEQRILHALVAQEYDPLMLPMNSQGKPGVKSAMRKLLPDLTPAVFDKAWKRLTRDGDIRYR